MSRVHGSIPLTPCLSYTLLVGILHSIMTSTVSSDQSRVMYGNWIMYIDWSIINYILWLVSIIRFLAFFLSTHLGITLVLLTTKRNAIRCPLPVSATGSSSGAEEFEPSLTFIRGDGSLRQGLLGECDPGVRRRARKLTCRCGQP